MGLPHNAIVLLILALTYLGVGVGRVPGLKLNRVGIALLGAIALMIFGGVTTEEAVAYVNWPTLFLLFGLFVVAAQLRLSGFYDLVAGRLARHGGSPAGFLALLMAVSAGLSAVLNNDIVCYVFAPIVGSTLLRRRINPVPFLIGLALACNLGAAATLIGNAQGMLLAEVFHLDFRNYLLWCLPPVIFGLAAAYGITWLLSRKRLAPPTRSEPGTEPPVIPFNRPHALKGLVILGLVIALFFSPIPKEIVVLAAAGIHLASRKFRTEDLLGLIDWPILVLFAAFFVVTGPLQATGDGERALRWLAERGLNLARPGNQVVATAALTDLIGNAPAVMILIKVLPISGPAAAYLIALANSFAGNAVLTASVANIIVVQQARTQGITISFGAFCRLGLPVALASLAGVVGWAWIAG